MPLRFRNIDTTPDAPVREWGFEGMLAALDRGYAPHWSRLASAVASEPGLREVFEEAAEAAESVATTTRHPTDPSPKSEAMPTLSTRFKETHFAFVALLSLATQRCFKSTEQYA